MKTVRSFSILAACLVALSFNSCTKEGPAGPAGAAGAPGNANVKSQIINVVAADWAGGGSGYEATKPCSIITSAIAEKGAVLVYVKEGDEYFPIPLSIFAGAWTTHFFFSHTVGNISFYTQDDDGLTLNPGNTTFKVVAVASASTLQEAGVDPNNYRAVANYFQLRD